jgi:stage III sporulation protein AC
MDVDLIFKIAGLGILISIIDKVLIQSGRDEQAQMTTLVGVVVVLLVVIQLISRLFESVRTMFQLY